MHYRKLLFAEPGKRLSLKKIDPGFKGKHKSHEAAKPEIEANRQKLAELQPVLWAQKQHSLLIVLQGMDASGKASCKARTTRSAPPRWVR